MLMLDTAMNGRPLDYGKVVLDEHFGWR